ncbi:MAG TPA: YjbH domain-containing protein, partial [Paracoccaceae bacterium]|nr:YjbH domain-containing protein [Paracoccaceae bacterium]
NVPISLDSGSLGFDVLLAGTASLRLGQGMSINGAVSQKIFGSAATDAEPSDSPTPVRSNAALYNDDGPSIDRLTADYVFKLSPTTFARVSAGYLETMFAGVSGEVLWKPVAQNWGLGFEVNAVQQRATGNLLGLDDYQAVTGYASLYVDTGFHDLEAQVDVGRYLAGDVGATFALSRHFANGWEVSGFVTLTDMSFEDYGDGNFTKGFEITIPLRWTMPLDTRSTLGLGLGNYSGDGGARLNLNNRLYPTIRDYESIDFEESWGAYWQ